MIDTGEIPVDGALCEALVAACRELTRRGLTYGTSGNISIRRDERSFFVSPTGTPYEDLEPASIPLLDFDGRWFGRRRPSSEWRFHRDILAARGDVGAIVHTHSRHATALACTGQQATTMPDGGPTFLCDLSALHRGGFICGDIYDIQGPQPN